MAKNISNHLLCSLFKTAKEEQIVLETLIAVSIIQLDIKPRQLYNRDRKSSILREMVSRKYFGITALVYAVREYYFGEKFKDVLNVKIVNKIKRNSFELYEKYSDDTKHFNEIRPLKKEKFEYHLENLISKMFIITAYLHLEDNSYVNITESKIFKLYDEKIYPELIAYIAKCSTPFKISEDSLEKKYLDSSNDDWLTKKTYQGSIVKKLNDARDEFIPSSINSFQSSLKTFWTNESLERYLRRKLKTIVQVSNSTVLCPPKYRYQVKRFLSRELLKVKNFSTSEIRSYQHPHFPISVALESGVKAVDFVDPDEVMSASITISKANYFFYTFKIKDLETEIKNQVGPMRCFYYCPINHSDLVKNTSENMTLGFVTFCHKKSIQHLNNFHWKGVTLKPDNDTILTEFVIKNSKKKHDVLFSFEDKTFKLQSRFFYSIKNSLEKFVYNLNRFTFNGEEILSISKSGEITIGRTKESAHSFKSVFLRVFQFLQPDHLETSQILFENELMKLKFIENLQRIFETYVVADGNSWFIYGSRETKNRVKTYLINYSTGKIPSYQIIYSFKDINALEMAIKWSNNLLNELKDVYIDWKNQNVVALGDYESRSNVEKYLQTAIKIEEGSDNDSMGETTDTEDIKKEDEVNENSMPARCSICWENYTVSKDDILPCKHYCCQECFEKYIMTLLERSMYGIGAVKCPRCPELYRVIKVKERISKIHWDLLVEKSSNNLIFEERRKKNISICKNKECHLGIINEKTLTCYKCASSACNLCRNVSHPGEQCHRAKTILESEYKAWSLKKSGRPFRYCPNCLFAAERISGCRSVSCKSCGKYFCWDCIDYFCDDEILSHSCRRKYTLIDF
ncbi:unnamed protein product [Dimorphilus gyrociliatus]|uniref:Uncharacterized protein n=1 Tax=Dimorphilus gyrociliatus TaxID=2664684 RepID=A0A7I8V5A6_9ANNE|nr:unnamed protein product [Dimorphilus gyrociliatus]